MKMDQASTLRQIVSGNGGNTKMASKKRKTRVVSITSGKGGVGKTNIAINLACALSSMGKKTVLLDADLGLANIDVLLNLSPPFNIEHVLSGEKNINEIIINGPLNTRILPASSGISEMAELGRDEQMRLFRKLSDLSQDIDYLLIDTGAGIASNVLRFNATADDIILVATPEPTSMTDAYSLIKILVQKYHVRQFNLLANIVSSRAEARAVYERLHKVANDFLETRLNYAGFILKDPSLIKAVRSQKALLEIAPKSNAAKCFFAMAKHLDQNINDSLPTLPRENYSENFWNRLMNWKKKR